MIRPSLIDSLTNAGSFDPGWLPAVEDDWHEYKSSKTPLGELARKLGVAASAFWNTGGGIFVAGVDGTGRPDGGVDLVVGRQALRDWVDQCLLAVTPLGPYAVRVFSDQSLQLATGKGILICAFAESEAAPHMGPDRKYYMRAGAHSNPAPSFLVEALFARRQASRPLLRHFVRMDPRHGHTFQAGLTTASAAQALDVTVKLPPLRLIGAAAKTFTVGSIGPQTPFVFDFAIASLDASERQPFDMEVTYRDAAGRSYSETITVDVDTQLGVFAIDHTNERLLRHLGDINRSLQELRLAVKAAAQTRS